MHPIINIFIGSLLLSIAHALIPSHWLPLIAIGKSEKWSEKELLVTTTITSISHISSTIIIGIIIGFAGYKLSESYFHITKIIAPVILIALSFIYFYLEYRHKKITSSHKHHHIDIETIIQKKKNKKSIILSLVVAMFFSPCLEIEIYYLTASQFGWTGIIIVSSVYFIVTVAGMLLLVFLASKGISKLKWNFLEHHDKLIAGLILFIVGLSALFIEY
ncbi:MAG: hypothetical protein QHH13_02150 [Melioribacter sp.]|uniref:urease accessory protein UreH domain-containing protein n=1 Tax=Rosettibacter primus TaxID=3111523 RepID=UPI00247C0654|nr:hypothetical protein [Melioribacter sp.]